MYNEYSNENFYHAQFMPTVVENNAEEYIQEKPQNNSIFSGLFNNFNSPEINSETLILFAIIFFAIYDDFDMDLIIILGILFLIGI